jgi:hypothetical protein
MKSLHALALPCLLGAPFVVFGRTIARSFTFTDKSPGQHDIPQSTAQSQGL